MKIQYEYIAVTIKGENNKYNNDRVLVGNTILSSDIDIKTCIGESSESLVAVICDGVGKSNHAAMAATIAVETFCSINLQEWFEKRLETGNHVFDCLHSINNRIRLYKPSEYRNKYATTIAGLMIYNNRYMVLNLGDSRVYKYSDGMMKQISKDHIIHGSLSRYLGANTARCNPEIQQGFINKGDYFIVCSDGLYKSITDIQIEEILSNQERSLEQKQKKLISEIIQNKRNDDISFIMIEIL